MVRSSGITEEDRDELPTGDNVDRLFDPRMRKKLREWLRVAHDPRLPVADRQQAKGNIDQVAEALRYEGQARPSSVTEHVTEDIVLEYPGILETCQTIFRMARRNENNKRLYVKERFPKRESKGNFSVGQGSIVPSEHGVLDSGYKV